MNFFRIVRQLGGFEAGGSPSWFLETTGGLAGALAESLGTRGSLRGAWLVNLASFNLGIEAFQVQLIVVLSQHITLSTRYAWSILAMRVASFAVFAAGLGWFAARTMGA